MHWLVKIILLFEIGLATGIFLFSPDQKTKILSVSSHLPDLVFPEAKSSFSIIFTGDVMLGRSVNTRTIKYSDHTWPFKKIGNFISQADMTVINLESPFVSDCKPTDSGMIFCSDPQNVAGLVSAGVDYATLANNHIKNYGEEGITDTKSTLKNNGITPVEQGKAEFNTVKNTKIALLAFCDLPQIENNLVRNQISSATPSADLVVVTFHWGNEYQAIPSQRQVDLAHLAIDSGADLVVGHHPHWTQTEEIYKDKPIYYSLGNLIFDQMWSEETRLGQILRVTFKNKELISKELISTKIFDYGQPVILEN